MSFETVLSFLVCFAPVLYCIYYIFTPEFDPWKREQRVLIFFICIESMFWCGVFWFRSPLARTEILGIRTASIVLVLGIELSLFILESEFLLRIINSRKRLSGFLAHLWISLWQELILFWYLIHYKPTKTQEIARKIMGKDFFGIWEAIRYFGVRPTREQISALDKIPFTEAELWEAKNRYLLVAMFPLSIIEIHDKVEQKLFKHDSSYDKETFANKRGTCCWLLVCKTPAENSTSRSWHEQEKAVFAKNEKVPTSQAMVYTIIGHFLATGERLFENIYVRCSDIDSGGHRAPLGFFDSHGLSIIQFWDDYRDRLIGVASARKPTNTERIQ